MCGILGQINKKSPVDPQRFDAMRDTLKHRGPDGAATWRDPNGRVMLGHRRLSFLDLSESGQQPMCNENRSLWLTCNGEIYNYIELRAELKTLGHTFKSNSDSEVLLHAYEEWGRDMLNKLKGMFAFAIWDAVQSKLFLARDRYGIKPLYYAESNDAFVFASELKAIATCQEIPLSVDRSSIADFLAYRFVPSPKTIYKEAKKVKPGYCIEYLKDGTLREWQYYTPFISARKENRKTVVERVGSLLQTSVDEHLRSDVEIGGFLSGGYDSSALVSFAAEKREQFKSFSIGFEGWKNSEHQFAELVAEKSNSQLFTRIATTEDFDLVDTLMYHYDEPIADISIIPTYLVSQLAAQHVKAVLSGEGADELFVGYTWQKDIAAQTTTGLQWAEGIRRIFSPTKNNHFVGLYAHAMAMGRFNNETLPSILHPDLVSDIHPNTEWFYTQHYHAFETPLKSFQFMDVKSFMGELVLTKIDRASMANSLEVRVPFLDHELVDYIFSLDERSYFEPSETKFALYENIKSRLPKQILDRKKQGFVGPDTFYMDINLYKNALEGGRLIQESVITNQGLNSLIQQEDHWRLWKLYILEKWWNVWQ